MHIADFELDVRDDRPYRRKETSLIFLNKIKIKEMSMVYMNFFIY